MKKRISISLGIFAIMIIGLGLVLQFIPLNNNEINDEDDDKLQYMNYESILFTVSHMEGKLSIYATNHLQFSGLRDTVEANQIIREKEPGLIRGVSSCAVFDNEYECSYEISGEDVKSALYVVEDLNYQHDNMTVGINYYDSMLNAEISKVTSIEFYYKESIRLNGINGNFVLSFNDFIQEDEKWDFWISIINISGNTEQEANIDLTWNQDHFELISDTNIYNLLVEGKDIYTSEMIASTTTNAIKDSYRITFDNGNFMIE